MKKLTLDWHNITAFCGEITRQIAVSDWKPDRIVGLSRGGLIPATMISHYYGIPLTCLHIQLRDSKSRNEIESNLWLPELALGYTDDPAIEFAELRSNILIVDDINDSGATREFLMEDWRASCLPNHEGWNAVWGNNVRFAVLVENLGSSCESNYYGTEINKRENDVWVEYPWEMWWR